MIIIANIRFVVKNNWKITQTHVKKFKMYLRTFFIIFLLLLSGNSYSNGFILKDNQLDHLVEAYSLSKQNMYDSSITVAKKSNDKGVVNFIKWMKFRSTKAENNFHEIQEFINSNPHWPSIKRLKNRAEQSISLNTDYREILQYFEKDPPITGYAMWLLAEAKIKKGRYNKKEVYSLIRQAWVQGDFALEIEDMILSRHSSILSQRTHIKRIDRLIWERKTDTASRILHLVGSNYKKLFSARIELMLNSSDLNNALKKVPKYLENDSGLLYEKAKWHQRQNDFDSVYYYISKVKNEEANYKKWWKVRNRLIREYIEQGKNKQAYKIAIGSDAEKGSFEYSQSQWFAGWIGLTKLNESGKAYKHFYNMYKNVKYPISLARASYWAGRAAEKNGFNDIAKKWYRISAKNPTIFYGQLAHTKIYGNTILKFPQESRVSSYKFVYENDLIKVATMLFQINEKELAETFLIQATDKAKSKQEFTQITHFARKLENNFYKVLVAKHAIRQKYLLIEDGWPVPEYFTKNLYRRPLSLAISRQESRFDETAVSSADAYGLMQIIPSTARQTAAKIGIAYKISELVDNPYYNVKIGNHYINSLIHEFDGSLVLAIASYNAGPSNTRKWIKRFGDPRNFNSHESVIEWIEHIPFKETRNYVQRVLENTQVYRYITDKQPVNLDKDLLL